MKRIKLMNHNKVFGLIISALLIVGINACNDDGPFVETETDAEDAIDLSDYADWKEESHSNLTDPNYSIVFNQNDVVRLDIKISSENWSVMQTDLSANLGASAGGPGGGPGGNTTSDYDPVWVPSSFYFKDIEWYHVGIRFKGNSSLRSTVQSGNKKLSFKLDFKEFEDDYPAMKNQRFFGFKQLNLNNNYDDASLMREKIGADLFRQFGLVSARTSFCIIYIDNGTGPQYYGVYALVEEVDDTVLDDHFANGSGNLYKPDGDAATFASGTFDTNEMELKPTKMQRTIPI